MHQQHDLHRSKFGPDGSAEITAEHTVRHSDGSHTVTFWAEWNGGALCFVIRCDRHGHKRLVIVRVHDNEARRIRNAIGANARP